MAEQWPFKPLVEGSSPSALIISHFRLKNWQILGIDPLKGGSFGICAPLVEIDFIATSGYVKTARLLELNGGIRP
jgi:hypothetical protein